MRRQRDDDAAPLSRSAKRARPYQFAQEDDDSTPFLEQPSKNNSPPQGGQPSPSQTHPLLHKDHDLPPRPDKASAEGQHRQVLSTQSRESPLARGGQTSPSQAPLNQLHDHHASPQGGDQAPSSETRRDLLDSSTRTFPHCDHIISGDLLRDFLSSEATECPRCQVESIQGTIRIMRFDQCGHTLRDDQLNDFFSSGPMQSPVLCLCNRSSSRAMDAEATARPKGKAIVFSRRSRITLPNYQDPRLMEGVTADFVIITKAGNPRFSVDPVVWGGMTHVERRRFHWCCNILFDLPPGRESQQTPNRGDSSQVNATAANPASTTPIASIHSEAGVTAPKISPGLSKEAQKQPAIRDAFARSDKKLHVSHFPTLAKVESTAYAPSKASAASTKPATSRDPTNIFIANPIKRPSADEIASGTAVWDRRLPSEWLSSPDWRPSFPCLFSSCDIKCTTADDLNAHILCDHDDDPPHGASAKAQPGFLNAAALERYFQGNIPPSAQAYIHGQFPRDVPPAKPDKSSSRGG